MWSKIWKIVNSPFYIIGSIASIFSVVILLFKDENSGFIALGFLCIALTLFLISLLRVLNRFLEKPTQDHKCISSFIQYTCDDGDNIIVETYKLIQVKCSLLQEYNAGFKWSGDNIPQISSELQKFRIVKASQDGCEYDYAVLDFKKPILYNETTIVHFKSIANDVKHVSLPYVEIPIIQPIEFIQICISLGYKDEKFIDTAKISKRKMTDSRQIQQNHNEYASIPFDQKHKQYLYRLINPQVGYSYKISWER